MCFTSKFCSQTLFEVLDLGKGCDRQQSLRCCDLTWFQGQMLSSGSLPVSGRNSFQTLFFLSQGTVAFISFSDSKKSCYLETGFPYSNEKH